MRLGLSSTVVGDRTGTAGVECDLPFVSFWSLYRSVSATRDEVVCARSRAIDIGTSHATNKLQKDEPLIAGACLHFRRNHIVIR